MGADRWAPPGAAAAAGQLPSAHARGGSGGGIGAARPRATRSAQDGGKPWLGHKERGRKEKGKRVFPFLIYFLNA